MRFTPTATFQMLAASPSKELQWNVCIRSVNGALPLPNGLSDSIANTDWTDVTPYIVDVPQMPSRIEYETGQFTADAISLEVNNIAWWKSTLNVSAGYYLEFRIQMTLKSGSLIASDTCYVFTGYVDINTPSFEEIGNKVKFKILTVEDIASRTPAELLTTQYLNTTLYPYDATTYAGMIGEDYTGAVCINIPGVFITNCAISGKVAPLGTYSIVFQRGSPDTLKLNTPYSQGRTVPLSGAGFYLLGDGTQEIQDTVQVYVLVFNSAILPPTLAEQTETFVVTTSSSTSYYPNRWYSYPSAKTALTNAFTLMGMMNFNYDYNNPFLDIPTSDGNPAVSVLDSPPGAAIVQGFPLPICVDVNDNLYIAVGNTIYYRVKSTGVYTQLVDHTGSPLVIYGAGAAILRMWYSYSSTSSADDHEDLWIYYAVNYITGSPTYNLLCFHTASSLNGSNAKYITNAIFMQAHGNQYVQCCELFFNHTNSLYQMIYGVGFNAAIDSNYAHSGIYGITISGNTLTAGLLFTNTALGQSTPNGVNARFACQRQTNFANDTFECTIYTSSFYEYKEIIFVSGSWVYSGVSPALGAPGSLFYSDSSYPNVAAAYVKTASYERVYFYNPANSAVYWHTWNSATPNADISLPNPAKGGLVSSMLADFTNGLIYFSTQNGSIYQITIGATDTENLFLNSAPSQPFPVPFTPLYTEFSAMALGSDRVWGMTSLGQLWQYGQGSSTTFLRVSLWLDNADFTGVSLLAAMQNIAQGLGLVWTTSPTSSTGVNKTANIFLRSTDAGTPSYNTSNVIALTNQNMETLVQNSLVQPAYDLVSVDNGGNPVTWGGNGMNSNVFSTGRILTISFPLIPSLLLKHLASWFYTFFSVNRSVYPITTPAIPLFAYEPFDGATINGGTNLALSGIAGPIVNAGYDKDGSTTFGVLA